MDQIINLTEEELTQLREGVVERLTLMRKGVLKKKFKVFGKTLLSLTLVVGGVAIAIVFPSPVVLAALGGAAALFGGTGGVLGNVKSIRRETTKRRTGKGELVEVDKEITKRKAVREFIVQQDPSAPPQYPSAPPQYPPLYPKL